ncbi:MAG: hypothetical protein JWL73_3844, partial [Actinomycetia bacterium]|nr:hypothetical protein [Actinomycetes bacterium]
RRLNREGPAGKCRRGASDLRLQHGGTRSSVERVVPLAGWPITETGVAVLACEVPFVVVDHIESTA